MQLNTRRGVRDGVGPPVPGEKPPKGVTNNQADTGKAERITGSLMQGAADMFQNLQDSMVAGWNKDMERKAGRDAYSRAMREGRKRTGSVIASIGSSGIRMSGSALAVVAESQRETIREAMMRERPHLYESLNQKYQQKASRTKAFSGMATALLRAKRIYDEDDTNG